MNTTQKQSPASERSGPLSDLAGEIHRIAVDHGFWPEGGRNMGEMLMLATSELAEALESDRNGESPVWYDTKHQPRCPVIDHRAYDMLVDEPSELCRCPKGKPEGVAVEIADCIIRCLDTMASLDVDIDAVIAEKMAYNRGREHRHGKAY